MTFEHSGRRTHGPICHPAPFPSAGLFANESKYVTNMGALVKRDRNHPAVVLWSFCGDNASSIDTEIPVSRFLTRNGGSAGCSGSMERIFGR